VLINAQRVERIPPGTYTVLAARGAAGSPDYSAVLFQMPGAELALAMPGVEQRAHTNTAPAMYLNGHAAGFAAYELQDATNQVRGYLLAPTGASVMIWDRAAKKDLVIIVNTLGGSPEGGGGGSGSGSGM